MRFLCWLTLHRFETFVTVYKRDEQQADVVFTRRCLRCGKDGDRSGIFDPVNVLILSAAVLLFFSVTYL